MPKPLVSAEEWKTVLKDYKKNQPERNRKRLQVLESEFSSLMEQGFYDESLLGDIEHQRKSLKSFDFPSEKGLDVGFKEVPPKEINKPKPKSDWKFPLNLLTPNFKKALGIEEEAKVEKPETSS